MAFSGELREQACKAKNTFLVNNAYLLMDQPNGKRWRLQPLDLPDSSWRRVWSRGWRHTVSYRGLVDDKWICGAVIADLRCPRRTLSVRLVVIVRLHGPGCRAALMRKN